MRQNIAMPATPKSATIVVANIAAKSQAPSAPTQVLDLVARFHEHRASYQAQSYNETQLRRDFLDPFFAALGWDMNNSSGTGEEARDVIHEYSMKIDGKNKAPDYCFRNGTTDKFFVEAKRPSVNLKDDPRSAFQTRVYGWNRNLPFCVLTDFEEFAVYDCRFKPKAGDSAHTARAFYCKYDEYEKQWPQIESLFGREAVRGGALEKHATQMPKKGMVAFDQDFLRLIEGWRERLAENIARRNRVLEMSQNDLNYAVQMTIDRVLFLRMCEDRDIEPYEQLKKLVGTKSIYKVLLDLFRQADNRYNSGLFHFSDAKTRSGISDKLTPKLQIDDNILSDILYSLYSPNPYNFRVMSVEILGQVYEQFLGKVIRLDKTKTVVEDKPEVRKAGGVYYTPSYIVDYIVRETVGKMCEGKTPKQIETLRVLDPACGSGSFLLGAYNFLLEWHLDYYIKNEPEKLAAKNKPAIARAIHREMPDENQTQSSKPVWRLTTSEKKRILQNNIFGVDIDRQAVEVSKLSLLLKMLEDESSDSLPTSQGRLIASQERILPDIDGNIKCGNSLIANDFYDDGAHDDLTNEERNRINAFDWNIEYSNVMKAGGFDVVIGNPPYIRIQALKEWAPLEAESLKHFYRSASVGNYDIYVVFVEKALSLLNKNGQMGYILPHKFFNAQYGAPLRELMSEGAHLSSVVHFGHQQIFASATTYTCLLFANKAKSAKVQISKVDDLEAWRESGEATTGEVPASQITGAEWNFSIGNDAALFDKLAQMPTKLGDVASIYQGLVTGADKVFALSLISRNKNTVRVYSKALDKQFELEAGIAKPLLKGSEIRRYKVDVAANVVLFPYKSIDGKVALLSETELKKNYPLTWIYLKEARSLLEARENGKWKVAQWWQFGRNQNIAEMAKPKLLSQVLSKHGSFASDASADYCFVGGATAGGYGIRLNQDDLHNTNYILGILNSPVTTFYVSKVASGFRGGFFAFGKGSLAPFPIRTIDFSDKADVARHDAMVKLVEQMLALHKQLAQARTSQDETSTRRQIASTDARIDKLVYELYELTAEEIAVVEGA